MPRFSVEGNKDFFDDVHGTAQQRFEISTLFNTLTQKFPQLENLTQAFEAQSAQSIARALADFSAVAGRAKSKEDIRRIQQLEHRLSLEDASANQFALAAGLLARHAGAEGARDLLLSVFSKKSAMQETVQKLLFVLNPEATEVVHKDLRDLYKTIRFEQYAVNEKMQAKDESLLAPLVKKGMAVADFGAGTGRLLKPLRESGADVVGIEFVKRHVDLMKKDVPDAKVINADWIKTGLPEESQDVVYSLGRSVLHEYQSDRQQALFAEVARVLKPGGRFCLDIPDRTKGNYAKLVAQYADAMKRRGLPFREGTIYDSPDGENFFTRYVFSQADMIALAEQNGLEVEAIERTPLPTGGGDENVYFTLRKKSVPTAQKTARPRPGYARQSEASPQ